MGMVNLSKICTALVFGSVFQYHDQNFFAVFFFLSLKGMHFLLQVSSRLVGGAFWLIRCPPNLHVAFNKIISEVQGCNTISALVGLTITAWTRPPSWTPWQPTIYVTDSQNENNTNIKTTTQPCNRLETSFVKFHLPRVLFQSTAVWHHLWWELAKTRSDESGSAVQVTS